MVDLSAYGIHLKTLASCIALSATSSAPFDLPWKILWFLSNQRCQQPARKIAPHFFLVILPLHRVQDLVKVDWVSWPIYRILHPALAAGCIFTMKEEMPGCFKTAELACDTSQITRYAPSQQNIMSKNFPF